MESISFVYVGHYFFPLNLGYMTLAFFYIFLINIPFSSPNLNLIPEK